MRVLVDTNIFIDRENYHLVSLNLQELLRMLSELRVEILVHPLSINEIGKDSNEERKKIALSKIRTYPTLEVPPDPNQNESFLKTAGLPSNPHDYCDVALLYAVYRDAVDFLISEDKGLHSKASRVNLSDRVLSTEEALAVFRRHVSSVTVKHPPALKSECVYNLDVRDPFFDSIKKEYPQFEQWFRRISREGRKCWAYFEEDGSLHALLIYKVENEAIRSHPVLEPKRRLKLCTFKVTHIGHKLGELFIKLSVQHCAKNNIEELYLTHYTKQNDSFVSLLTEYGFFHAAKIDGEDVYLKKLIPDKETTGPLSAKEISRLYYPSFYDGTSVRKFVVPIRPEYHDRLFTEYRGRQTTIPEHTGEFIVEGNTISKAYLSHSRTGQISKGDILIFYRSRDLRELTALGVAENVYFDQRNKDKIIRLVGKRTVYRLDEIEELVRKPTLVILFKWHCYLPNPLKLATLKRAGILTEAPQTITRVSHMKYLRIKKESGLDERYTVD